MADESPRATPLARLLAGWEHALRLGNDAAVARELEQADDLFLLLCLGESLGLPNPTGWYTLELYPLLLEEWHEWHRRMGLEHSPLEHLRCC